MNSGFLGVRWLWLYAGVILMFMELMAPGFVIFFFGLAAATVGGALFVLPALGVQLSLTAQVILFTILCIAYLWGLRRYMKRVFMGDTEETKITKSDFDGRIGTVVEAISPTLPGRILLGDSEWSAEAETPLEVGTKVRVVAQKNLTMIVESV